MRKLKAIVVVAVLPSPRWWPVPATSRFPSNRSGARCRPVDIQSKAPLGGQRRRPWWPRTTRVRPSPPLDDGTFVFDDVPLGLYYLEL